ncbi:MarR family winged helix-turn-helix transcriptional regulator [Paraburkholderia guartelaensis]|uniref:MarR family winged helix-turn-helix transcriptional regulator n=1 Tax=Paraburkholderia guartelaensis TaxID=2546446 RepID=UPI002AB65F84|nr:MarR family winged helix-turn-helix transcriptional regulator [Paraburkholderia guartelaensis]
MTNSTSSARQKAPPHVTGGGAGGNDEFRLNRIPGFLIRRIQQILTAMVFEETDDCEVTPVQVAVMMSVREFPGSDQKRLAEIIAIDQSTIGNVAERLEQRGVLVRKPKPGDRRYKVLELTRAGEKLLDRSEPGVWAAQEKFFACLTNAERVAFFETLQKLVRVNGDHARVAQDLPPVATRVIKRPR